MARLLMRKIRVDDEIELRAVTSDMAGELFEVVERNLDHLHEWMQWAVEGYSISHTRAFTELSERQWVAGQTMNYLIFVEGEIAGGAGYNFVDRTNRGTELGYWLERRRTGKGIVTRSVRSLIEHAFGDLEMHRVVIRCAEGNTRSRAIPEKLGFTEEGTMRECECLHDRYVDLVVYSMLRSEWKDGER